MKRTFQILSVVSAFFSCFAWLHCPAPRAPDNGLNFIFRNGEVIHFRCHPGYVMHGNAVAHCVNNQWTHSTPRCLPIKRGLRDSTIESKNLFNWGDGARRLPLINGIWPLNGTPKVMVKEEIDIAELRHKQLQELKKRRKQNRGNKLSKKKKRRMLAEFQGRPIEIIGFDASCVENVYGRSLPKIAPSIPHAFVYAYETKKNKNHPFNTYMEAKYKCVTGYKFARTQTLFCRNNSWIGEKPKCIKS